MFPPCLYTSYITDIYVRTHRWLFFIVREERKYFYYAVGDRIHLSGEEVEGGPGFCFLLRRCSPSGVE